MSHITYSSKWHCSLCIDSRQGGRDENQDSCGYKETPFGFLVVVCDGMGGGPAGANASMLAVQSIIQEVDKAAQAQTPSVVLKNAIIATNVILRRTIREHRELMGMGTTCVAALFSTNNVVVAHVGDSRLYQFRNGKLLFKTADHSVVGELVRRGEITEEEAKRAENSNVITRSLGISDSVEVEMNVLSIIPNDRIVLCTDGVWGMLHEKDLMDSLCKKERIDIILPRLLNRIELLGKSKPKGNYDNLSLGIIHINKHVATNTTGSKYSLFKLLIVFVLLLSVGANIYLFTTKDNERNAPSVVYNKAISNEEVNTDKSLHSDEDTYLERQFAIRREHDYKDSIAEMQRQIMEKEQSIKSGKITQDRIRRLNRIAKDVKSLYTSKGGDVKKILNKKRSKQQQIVKDFEQLRKDYNQSNVNSKKYKEISLRLSGSVIIETQKDGKSTKAAKQEINDLAKQINALR